MELNGTKQIITSPKRITFIQKWMDETKKIYVPYFKAMLIGVGIIAAIIIEASTHILSYLLQLFDSFAWYWYVITIILLLPVFYALGKVTNNGSMKSDIFFMILACIIGVFALAFGLVASSVFLCTIGLMAFAFFFGAMWNS